MIGFPREESNHRLDPDLWLCLICGFTGCGTRHGGHIQRHYEESLHTYAQNTETRQVWDFAGDGYVHRLVLNAPSEGDLVVAADADAAHSGKVVELADPHSLLNSRDPRAPMSPEQEQQVVSAKLEAVARHYNQVLAWQLEQNRLLYETRLQRIRDSARSSSNNTNHQRHQVSASPLSAVGSKCVAPTGKAKGGSKTDKSGSCSVSSRKYCGPTWRENMIASLRNERAKLLKQAEGAKERLARAHREVEVLRELNGSLAHNQGEWQKRVDTAAKVLANAEATYQ